MPRYLLPTTFGYSLVNRKRPFSMSLVTLLSVQGDVPSNTFECIRQCAMLQFSVTTAQDA